jgi:uncharacterized protein (TIRG00374 family)
MKPALVRSVRLAAVAILIVGMLAYVRRIPWMTAAATMRHASPGLLVLALCFHFVALTGKAGIWWTFLRPLGGPRFRTVARGTLMGATLNSLFVGSSGEAGRVLLMSRLTGIPSASVVATVVLERAVDLCGFLTLLTCAAFLFPIARVLTVGAAAALIVVVALVTVLRARRHPGGRSDPSTVASSSFVRRCRCYIQRIFLSTRSIATKRRLAIAIALTIVDWCSELASYSIVARAAHFPIGVSGSLLALLAVNVGFLVRVTPGNVGVFELVYATVAHSLGFSTDVAIGVALMLHLVQDVPTALLGLTLGMRFFAPLRKGADRGRRIPALLQPSIAIPTSTAPQREPARGALL